MFLFDGKGSLPSTIWDLLQKFQAKIEGNIGSVTAYVSNYESISAQMRGKSGDKTEVYLQKTKLWKGFTGYAFSEGNDYKNVTDKIEKVGEWKRTYRLDPKSNCLITGPTRPTFWRGHDAASAKHCWRDNRKVCRLGSAST